MSNGTEHLTPQQILFQTIKSLVLKVNNMVKDLGDQHEDLKKRFDARSRKINEYIVTNENWRKEISSEIESLKSDLEKIREEVVRINDHLKEKEMEKNVWLKVLRWIQGFPGAILAFVSGVIAILTYFANHFNWLQ